MKERRPILELYFICFCATTLLPENLLTDPAGGWIGALVSRLTLISAIARLCWLASLPTRSWYLTFSVVAATIFFTFIYQDTGFLNRMEASADRVTQQLPFGTRTVSTIFAPNDYRTIFSISPIARVSATVSSFPTTNRPPVSFVSASREGSPRRHRLR